MKPNFLDYPDFSKIKKKLQGQIFFPSSVFSKQTERLQAIDFNPHLVPETLKGVMTCAPWLEVLDTIPPPTELMGLLGTR
jgi:hypothetical protein